jgi:hypothetical protein
MVKAEEKKNPNVLSSRYVQGFISNMRTQEDIDALALNTYGLNTYKIPLGKKFEERFPPRMASALINEVITLEECDLKCKFDGKVIYFDNFKKKITESDATTYLKFKPLIRLILKVSYSWSVNGNIGYKITVTQMEIGKVSDNMLKLMKDEYAFGDEESD